MRTRDSASAAHRPGATLVGLLLGILLVDRARVVRGGDLVAADGTLLFKVDPATGMRSVLSDFADSTQGPTGSSFNVAAGPAGAVYVTDGATDEHGKLFEVHADGTRAVRSDAGQASQGDPWHTPSGVFMDTDGSILVSDRGFGGGGNAAGLWRTSATDGSRVKLSDFGGAPEGVALDGTGQILLGDAEGGTDCHTFGGCGALYRVDGTTGMRTTLGDFGAALQGPLGEDAGNALALDVDDTILVVDPFAPPGSVDCSDTGGCGVLFRWDPLAMTHAIVTSYGDAMQGTVSSFRPKGVAVAANGTIFISPCPGSGGRGAICTVDRTTGARTTFSDFGDPDQGPLGFGPISLAIADLGSTTTTTSPTTTTTTMPGDCGERAPTFVSIDCRLEILIGRIGQAQNLKQLQAGLLKGAMRAKTQKEAAEGLAGHAPARQVKAALRHAIRNMISLGFRLRSRAARQTIRPPETRTALLDLATPILRDMQALLKSLPKP